jgi:hypothetical protein
LKHLHTLFKAEEGFLEKIKANHHAELLEDGRSPAYNIHMPPGRGIEGTGEYGFHALDFITGAPGGQYCSPGGFSAIMPP